MNAHSDDPTGPSTAPDSAAKRDVTLAEFQQLIRRMYLEKDIARGVEGTFMWLMEEIGELATALRNGTHEERVGEFADVLAWLTTIANVVGVDLTRGRDAEVRGRLPRLRPVRLHLPGRRQAMNSHSYFGLRISISAQPPCLLVLLLASLLLPAGARPGPQRAPAAAGVRRHSRRFCRSL